uniref:Uncharacterized protein n=1 Tax=Kalanchoe fedtschenkoi TaxID=63787 RepID=A0A7N1A895_KALFE
MISTLCSSTMHVDLVKGRSFVLDFIFVCNFTSFYYVSLSNMHGLIFFSRSYIVLFI